jgi:hypothetical protein
LLVFSGHARRRLRHLGFRANGRLLTMGRLRLAPGWLATFDSGLRGELRRDGLHLSSGDRRNDWLCVSLLMSERTQLRRGNRRLSRFDQLEPVLELRWCRRR